MKKKKLKSILINALSWSLFILCLSSCNQAENEIKRECPDCTIEEIEGTEILITTNTEGLANFYNTKSQSFMLSNWIEAKYSPGIIYDDITITIDGQKIYLFKDDFNNISDSYIQQKLTAKNKEESNESGSSSNSYCSKHSKMYLKENGCSECLYDDVEDELNKPGGFRDRASHL
jgi:hypothetical protein